jgi:hypothetical protein
VDRVELGHTSLRVLRSSVIIPPVLPFLHHRHSKENINRFCPHLLKHSAGGTPSCSGETFNAVIYFG